MNVVILGASDKKDRYSYLCLNMLKAHGYNPIPVHPTLSKIEGYKVYSNLKKVKADFKSVDTLTLYVRPELSSSLVQEIISLNPRRAIFNPGSENKEIYPLLEKVGIEIEEACTLVLLQTQQFE